MSLFLVCPADDTATEFDFVQGDERGTERAQGRAPATLLPPAAREGVVLVLRSAQVAWHRLRLPVPVAAPLLAQRADPARVRAVLGAALEEQLLEEPDALHLAVFADEADPTPPAGQRSLWVAVCRRAMLRAASQALEAAGLMLRSIVCEAEPLPADQPAQLLWSGPADAPRWTLQSVQGVAWLPTASVALALAQAHSVSQWLAEPAVLAPAEAARVQVPPGQESPQVQLQTQSQRWLLAANQGRNLAQLEWRSTRQARMERSLAGVLQTLLQSPLWRPARWAVVVLALVHLVGLQALAWSEQRQLRQQAQQVQTLLLETFPETTLVVDAPLQMRRSVEALALTRGAAAGLDVARALALAAAHAPGEWTAVALQDGQLRLRGGGPWPAPALDALNTALSPLSLRAHWNDAEGGALWIQAGAQP